MLDYKSGLMAQGSAFSIVVKCLNDMLEKKLAILDNTNILLNLGVIVNSVLQLAS